jgi:hypothetical protein
MAMAAIATTEIENATWETWGEEDLAPARHRPGFSALTWAIALTAAYNMGVRTGITTMAPVDRTAPASAG